MDRLGTLETLETENSTLQLEVWRAPSGAPRRGVVILHPWAKLGGSMEDPTVIFNFRAAVRSGLFSTVVRYNMRGAGGSVAKRAKLSWGLLTAPEADPQDCVEVCQHVMRQGSVAPPTQLYLVAYSYGATVAASALQQVPQVVGYVGIGFPLGSMANLVLRSRAHWAELERSPIPKLLIAGTRDSYCPLSTLRSFVAEYNALVEEDERGGGPRQQAQGQQPGPLELQTLDGADHFFPGQWEEVADRVMSWIDKQAEAQATGAATA